jgi:hypothetical protein
MVEHETFLLPNGDLILFKVQHFSGMVGEHCELHSVKRIFLRTDPESIATLASQTYAQLKQIYNTELKDSGYYIRRAFWRRMKEFSPEGIKARNEEEHFDAVSRVI